MLRSKKKKYSQCLCGFESCIIPLVLFEAVDIAKWVLIETDETSALRGTRIAMLVIDAVCLFGFVVLAMFSSRSIYLMDPARLRVIFATLHIIATIGSVCLLGFSYSNRNSYSDPSTQQTTTATTTNSSSNSVEYWNAILDQKEQETSLSFLEILSAIILFECIKLAFVPLLERKSDVREGRRGRRDIVSVVRGSGDDDYQQENESPGSSPVVGAIGSSGDLEGRGHSTTLNEQSLLFIHVILRNVLVISVVVANMEFGEWPRTSIAGLLLISLCVVTTLVEFKCTPSQMLLLFMKRPEQRYCTGVAGDVTDQQMPDSVVRISSKKNKKGSGGNSGGATGGGGSKANKNSSSNHNNHKKNGKNSNNNNNTYRNSSDQIEKLSLFERHNLSQMSLAKQVNFMGEQFNLSANGGGNLKSDASISPVGASAIGLIEPNGHLSRTAFSLAFHKDVSTMNNLPLLNNTNSKHSFLGISNSEVFLGSSSSHQQQQSLQQSSLQQQQQQSMSQSQKQMSQSQKQSQQLMLLDVDQTMLERDNSMRRDDRLSIGGRRQVQMKLQQSQQQQPQSQQRYLYQARGKSQSSSSGGGQHVQFVATKNCEFSIKVNNHEDDDYENGNHDGYQNSSDGFRDSINYGDDDEDDEYAKQNKEAKRNAMKLRRKQFLKTSLLSRRKRATVHNCAESEYMSTKFIPRSLRSIDDQTPIYQVIENISLGLLCYDVETKDIVFTNGQIKEIFNESKDEDVLRVMLQQKNYVIQHEVGSPSHGMQGGGGGGGGAAQASRNLDMLPADLFSQDYRIASTLNNLNMQPSVTDFYSRQQQQFKAASNLQQTMTQLNAMEAHQHQRQGGFNIPESNQNHGDPMSRKRIIYSQAKTLKLQLKELEEAIQSHDVESDTLLESRIRFMAAVYGNGSGKKRDGKERILQITLTPLLSSDKLIVLFIVEDVTYFNQIKVLESLNKNKSFMLSQVSHEIRNPVSCIIAMLEEIQQVFLHFQRERNNTS